jgi:hypothetical protein
MTKERQTDSILATHAYIRVTSFWIVMPWSYPATSLHDLNLQRSDNLKYRKTSDILILLFFSDKWLEIEYNFTAI